VWDWLDKKPKIKWQLELWLGQAHRALGAQAMQAGDEAAGLDHWNEAEQALLVARQESNAIYYAYYELGQLHEAEGELAARKGDAQEAMRQYAQARDMYVETFNRKDNVPSGQAPFDYAYLLLGRIYEKLGDPDRALTYYSRLLTGSLYSKNTQTYQYARDRIHVLTGQWQGEPPDQPLQGESVKDEPASWLPSPNSSTGST
jgi:tetratricopeptide (TPR) repeat protein